MAATTRSSCLIIKGDDSTIFKLDLANNATTNWDDFHKRTTWQMVEVKGQGRDDPDTNDALFQMAVAIKSCPSINRIKFAACHVDEIGHLCAVASDRQLVLLFADCKLEIRSAKTLQLMLQASLLGELIFVNCIISDSMASIIESGLLDNRSLSKFSWTSKKNKVPANIMNGVSVMLNNNDKIVTLTMSAKDSSFWNVFRAANEIKSLETLSIYDGRIDIHTVETMFLKACLIPSLVNFRFRRCTFMHNAMEFFIQTLTKHKILDSLTLVGCTTLTTTDDAIPSAWNFGKLQVRKLSLMKSESPGTMPLILEDLCSNPFIQSLDISGISESFPQDLCDGLIRRNSGPSELQFHCIENNAVLLEDAMLENTRLKSLRISGLISNHLATIAQGLVNMRGLRKLTLDLCDDTVVTQDIFQALEQSLEENNNLWTLVIHNMRSNNAHAAEYLPKIRRRLAINRVGGHSLMSEPVPVGIWPYVLAKSSADADGIYFVLMGKPDIVAPGRKRKHNG